MRLPCRNIIALPRHPAFPPPGACRPVRPSSAGLLASTLQLRRRAGTAGAARGRRCRRRWAGARAARSQPRAARWPGPRRAPAPRSSWRRPPRWATACRRCRAAWRPACCPAARRATPARRCPRRPRRCRPPVRSRQVAGPPYQLERHSRASFLGCLGARAAAGCWRAHGLLLELLLGSEREAAV